MSAGVAIGTLIYGLGALFTAAALLGDYGAMETHYGRQSERTKKAARRVFIWPLIWPALIAVGIARLASVALGRAR